MALLFTFLVAALGLTFVAVVRAARRETPPRAFRGNGDPVLYTAALLTALSTVVWGFLRPLPPGLVAGMGVYILVITSLVIWRRRRLKAVGKQIMPVSPRGGAAEGEAEGEWIG